MRLSVLSTVIILLPTRAKLADLDPYFLGSAVSVTGLFFYFSNPTGTKVFSEPEIAYSHLESFRSNSSYRIMSSSTS